MNFSISFSLHYRSRYPINPCPHHDTHYEDSRSTQTALPATLPADGGHHCRANHPPVISSAAGLTGGKLGIHSQYSGRATCAAATSSRWLAVEVALKLKMPKKAIPRELKIPGQRMRKRVRRVGFRVEMAFRRRTVREPREVEPQKYCVVLPAWRRRSLWTIPSLLTSSTTSRSALSLSVSLL